MDSLTTVDDLLEWFKEKASQNAPLDPLMYIEAGTKLQALAGNEKDRLIELEFEVAGIREAYLTEYGTGVKAKIHVEATPPYKEMKKQAARCDQIESMVQLSKHWARIKNEQLRSGL